MVVASVGYRASMSVILDGIHGMLMRNIERCDAWRREGGIRTHEALKA